MRAGTDGQAQPFTEIDSKYGPIRWVDMATHPEVIPHSEKQYLRRSDYLVQYINLMFGDKRATSDLDVRRNYFLEAFAGVGGSEDFIQQVRDVLEHDRVGPNEDWHTGYKQYWFDMAQLYATKSLIDQGGNEELLTLHEGVSGSKKYKWIAESLDHIDNQEGAREAGTYLHNIAYDIAPIFSMEDDIGSWRSGVDQAYEDFVHWVVESKL